MAKVLVGLPNVRVFIDDILIASETLEEHFRDIAEVIKRLSQWGSVVNPKKVRFLLAKVKFLGFICSREGIRVDHEKTSAIAKIKPPRTVKQVRMFLGACNYFQSHIEHYASICSSLYELTAKGVPFVWSDSCEESFRALKEALITAPCLAYLNFSGKFPFLLQCDASSAVTRGSRW